jgi:hypothetical protein
MAMRTTLTLDDEVAARLDRLRKVRGLGLKQAVNEALRAGLEAVEAGPRARRRVFRQETFRMEPFVVDLDDIGQALARAEGEAFR